ERQPDVEADRLAARLAGAAVGRLHDAGAAAGGDDEPMVLGLEAQGPGGEQAGQLARLLVVARPFHRLAAAAQFELVFLFRAVLAARPQRLQRPLGAIAAVDARRSEEDDGVLDLLFLEAAQRLEV